LFTFAHNSEEEKRLEKLGWSTGKYGSLERSDKRFGYFDEWNWTALWFPNPDPKFTKEYPHSKGVISSWGKKLNWEYVSTFQQYTVETCNGEFRLIRHQDEEIDYATRNYEEMKNFLEPAKAFGLDDDSVAFIGSDFGFSGLVNKNEGERVSGISAIAEKIGKVTVFYGTNRTISDKLQLIENALTLSDFHNALQIGQADLADYEIYSTDEDFQLHQGICNVTVPRDHVPGQIGESKSLVSGWIAKFSRWWKDTRDPSALFITGNEEMNTEEFDSSLRSFRREIAGGNHSQDILLVIHGYNVSFCDCVKRTAQLSYDIQWAGVSACYSWPSKATTLGYFHDAERVENAIPFFQEFVANLLKPLYGTEGKLHILSHSMGNRLTVRSLSSAHFTSNIANIVFAAPDVPSSEFEKQTDMFASVDPGELFKYGGFFPTVEELFGLTDEISLHAYSSTEDLALFVSSLVNWNERAGADDSEPDSTYTRIEVANVSGLLKHSYIYEEKKVFFDFRDLLNSIPAEERNLQQTGPKSFLLDIKSS